MDVIEHACRNCGHAYADHSMAGTCMESCDCECYVPTIESAIPASPWRVNTPPPIEPFVFVPLLCRVRLHRWRVPINWTVRKGTCRCERCGRLKGPGAT